MHIVPSVWDILPLLNLDHSFAELCAATDLPFSVFFLFLYSKAVFDFVVLCSPFCFSCSFIKTDQSPLSLSLKRFLCGSSLGVERILDLWNRRHLHPNQSLAFGLGGSQIRVGAFGLFLCSFS